MFGRRGAAEDVALVEVDGDQAESEPELPPFDPAKVEPIPYEDEIRAFIEELKAEQT